MNKLLEIKQVKRTFSRKGQSPLDVLSSVNLEVSEGERVAILGQSGAGKSTLLHIMGTLESPTGGTVQFLGKDVFSLREAELSKFRNQHLGFVFQFHYLMLEFDALENVMMPALLSGMNKSKARKRATDLLVRVGLEGRTSHKPSQLSGGEQQRVAIARALMNEPKLLLTDEMTGNLDPSTGRRVFELVQSIHSELKMAMISVTHDEKLAKAYPRIYRLKDGGLVRQ